MIRTNLSTRPFYHERLVHLWLAAGFLLILAATIFNVTHVIRYSASDTELGTQASRDEERAATARTLAGRLRSSVDSKQVELASLAARQANNLIDRRVFSWTELLNQFEAALPDEVRFTGVRPKTERGQLVLTITVVARSADDINKFMENIEATGLFTRPGVEFEEHFNEQGQLEATVQAVYRAAPAQTGERQ
jgi:Tfp pilus assembly protein PilN